ELFVCAIAVGINWNFEELQKTINSDKFMAILSFQKILLFMFKNRAYVSWVRIPRLNRRIDV
ncbi:MAG: hypothetical protein ACKPDM_10095, partial [Dolichospermum sp.]